MMGNIPGNEQRKKETRGPAKTGKVDKTQVTLMGAGHAITMETGSGGARLWDTEAKAHDPEEETGGG